MSSTTLSRVDLVNVLGRDARVLLRNSADRPTLGHGTLTDKGKAVIDAIGAGEISPGQGAVLLAALVKLQEADEIERRITALEDKQALKDRRGGST